MSHTRKNRDAKCRRIELPDDALLDLLDNLRTMANDGLAEPAAIESAIAELEVEASCRGLVLPATDHEPTPQPLALHLLWAALAKGDHDAVARVLTSLDAGALWFAYRKIREVSGPHVRQHYLEHVLFCLDSLVFGEERARERREWLATSELSSEDRTAYVEQCLNAMFGGLLAYGSPELP